MKKEKSLLLLMIACFISNISQIPYLVNLGITRLVNIPIWIIILLYFLIFKKLVITNSFLKIYIKLGIVIIGLLFFTIITNTSYFNSSIFISLILSIFIFTIGYLAKDYLQKDDIRKIMISYSLSSVIVSWLIYIGYFYKKSNLFTTIYVYSSKNSISQIIFISIIILFFLDLDYKNKIMKLIKSGIILFQIILLFMLRSRVVIFSFILVLIYLIFTKGINRKIKICFLIFSLMFVICIYLNEDIYSLIVEKIIFAGRDYNNLDSLSSGRVSIVASFPELIQNNYITGIGSIYFECFPLSIILNFGCIIGFLAMYISYFPIIRSVKMRNKNLYTKIFFIISMSYLFNSFFEGLAPIGPGAKCYFLWLLFGILFKKENN